MAVLDDLRREKEEQMRRNEEERLSRDHSAEDFVIDIVPKILEARIRNGIYKSVYIPDDHDDNGYVIDAHLGRLRCGNEYKWALLDECYDWRERPGLYRGAFHFPFKHRLDEKYLKEKLPPRIHELVGAGYIWISVLQAYTVKRKLHGFNDVNDVDRYTVNIEYHFHI